MARDDRIGVKGASARCGSKFNEIPQGINAKKRMSLLVREDGARQAKNGRTAGVSRLVRRNHQLA
jgi:hypothetical protein